STVELLERDHDLRTLARALDEASAGHGRIVLVGGEAGIGKTAFVEHFVATRGRSLRVLKGNCDPLFTPTPLGPLYDIGRQTGGKLAAQLESGAPRAALFDALLDQLRCTAQPILLVFEDLHWADEATLDLIKFLSRRAAQARLLLVVTYREDEVGAHRPLRMLLGDLAASRAVIRIDLSRLTVDAVRTLIGDRPFDAAAVHRKTAGNPFFVTEILSNASPGIPATVRDAVLARAAQLGPAGRKVLDAAAVIGNRIEHRMLEKVLYGDVVGLADCIKVGILVEAAGDCVAFRHELARDAVLSDIDPGRRRALNRLALAALRGDGARRVSLAQLAQYAEGAGDAAAVLEYGLAAARTAAGVGAHREAAAQYRRVIRFAGDRPAGERAHFYESYAEECSTIDELAEAEGARRMAIELWREAGDRVKEGQNLAELAWPLVRSGQNAAAEDVCRRAVAVLERMPPTRQLAAAYRVQAHLRMLDRDRSAAVRIGRRAIELAARFQDDAVTAAAEMVVGSAMLVAGDDRGRPHLDRSLAIAREKGLDALVGLIHVNIGSSYGEQYRFAEAERQLVEGIAYTRERDLDHANHYMCAWLALTRLYQGRWSEASDIASALVARPNVATVSRIMALVALGRVRTRRGDPGAAAALDEALSLASQTGTLQRLAPVRAARAEAAWLASDRGRVIEEAKAAYDLAARHRHRWHVGEFSYWRRIAGDRVSAPAWAARPFLLQIKGDWRAAARAWERTGCPYEQARALADGDVPAQLEALEIFTGLGAEPAAAALRRRMRDDGVRAIPRGPRPSTRQNPFGLTIREMEILGCLAEGLSNARIGAQLHLSTKTVDHHVSSVLAKLGAASRGEAGRIAHEQRLFAQNRDAAAAK
ncbi:MAG TPA: AAA family ATPase, partial [Alphaproteobacteria bacterium]|nr:AAA family ATPase [Alphaproteobacteria bacterium]